MWRSYRLERLSICGIRNSNWYKMSEAYIGVVFHYYSDIQVAILKLTDRLAIGDQVRFLSPRGKLEGERVDFIQLIESLQIDRQPVEAAESGRKVHPLSAC
jgi:hypothetical protein